MREGRAVQRKRQIRIAIERLLVTLAERKEDLMLFGQVLIHAHRIGSVKDWMDRAKYKIAFTLVVRRHSAGDGRPLLLPVLFPGEEEEGFVVPVINLWNPDRSSPGATVVVFLVYVPVSASKIVKPFICVQIVVTENVESA